MIRLVTFTFASSISGLIMVVCIGKFLKIKIKYSYKNIFILIFLSFLVSINNVYNYKIALLPFNFIFSCFLIHFWYPENSKEIFKSTLIFFSVSLLVEILFSVLLVIFKIKNISMLNNNIIIKSSFTIFNSLIVLFVFSIKRIVTVFKKSKKILINVDNYFSLMTIFLILATLLIYHYSTDFYKITNYIFIILVFFIIILIIFKLLVTNMKKNLLSDYNEALIDSLKDYEIINDEYMLLKHNLLNDLIKIKINDSKENIEELIEKYCNQKSNIQNISQLPNGIIGLIYYKRQLMQYMQLKKARKK